MTSSICCVRLPRCHWDKNYTWQKELRSHWSNNLEQSSGRSATQLAVTAVIWTKTETVFVRAMSAPEEFCLSRAIQMFALLLLLLLLTLLIQKNKRNFSTITSRVSASPRRRHCRCRMPGQQERKVRRQIRNLSGDHHRTAAIVTTAQTPLLPSQQLRRYHR